MKTKLHAVARLCLVCGCLAAAISASAQPVQASLNDSIVYWAKKGYGKKIGDGNCWDFVNAVFRKTGARRRGTYVWGHEFYSLDKGGSIGGESQDSRYRVKPGDVIQFFNARFVYPDGTWREARQHSAIVMGTSNNGRYLVVYHQNSGKRRYVTKGSYNLNYLTRGQIHIYRPTQ